MEQISIGLDAQSSESYESWVNFGIVETIYKKFGFLLEGICGVRSILGFGQN
jgi:hypothetical protein